MDGLEGETNETRSAHDVWERTGVEALLLEERDEV